MLKQKSLLKKCSGLSYQGGVRTVGEDMKRTGMGGERKVSHTW